MHMAVMVMTMIDDGHALQRCMERQAQEGEPRNSSQHRLFMTIVRVLMRVMMSVLNAVRQEFEEDLDDKAKKHKQPCFGCGCKRLGKQMEKRHADDERPSKGHEKRHVMDATLPHDLKECASNQGGQKKNERSHNHRRKGALLFLTIIKQRGDCSVQG